MEGTIHIFAYGETQLNSSEGTAKVTTTDLTTVQAVITEVTSKKPADKVTGDYHAINIFGGLRADYLGKEDRDNTTFLVPIADLSAALIDALKAELVALIPVA